MGLQTLALLLILPWALAQSADGWSAPVEVRKGNQKAVTYRMQLAGDWETWRKLAARGVWVNGCA